MISIFFLFAMVSFFFLLSTITPLCIYLRISYLLQVFFFLSSAGFHLETSVSKVRTHYALGRADQLKVSVQKSYLLFLHILNPSFLSVFSQNLSKSVTILVCAFNRTLFGRIAQSVTIANELILNCSYTVTDGKTKLLIGSSGGGGKNENGTIFLEDLRCGGCGGYGSGMRCNRNAWRTRRKVG